MEANTLLFSERSRRQFSLALQFQCCWSAKAVFQISTEKVSRPGKILSVKPVLSRKQALNQLLWNSQFLRIDAKPIFNNKLFSKGLVSLADVWTNTDSLNCWTFFKAEGLNLNDYLLLYGLFNSLPLTWKKLINSKYWAQLHTLFKRGYSSSCFNHLLEIVLETYRNYPGLSISTAWI